MWWARSEVVDVYLSGSTLALRDGRAPVQQRAVEQGDWKAALQAVLASHPSRRWRLWLGGRLCALRSVEPIDGIRQIEEAEAAVAALLSAQGPPVDVRLAVWSASVGGTWVAAAMPAGLPADCEQMVTASGGTLSSLRPWWVAFSSALGPDAAVFDDEALHYWRSGETGQVTGAGGFVATGQARTQALQRLRVAGPLPAWRLELTGHEAEMRAGFAVHPFNEDADAAARPAV